MSFRDRARPATLRLVTTTTTANRHYWAITTITAAGGDTPAHRAGAAATHTEAWTHALAAGRTALLAGELATLAVTVDDQHPSALYDPGHDEHGNLDSAKVTAALVEIHQAVTASDLTEQLATGRGSTARPPPSCATSCRGSRRSTGPR